MKLLTGFGAHREQTITTRDEFAEPIKLTLRYMPFVWRWTVSVAHKRLTVNNLLMVRHWNMLTQFSNFCFFGLMIDTVDKVDPFLISDFETGRVKIYLLDTYDLEYIKRNL
jgi:hypothetical protein